MKSVRLLAATLAVIFGLQATAAVTPPSYPLRVRGGRLNIRLESTNTPSLVKMIVGFAPGTARADAGLRPGQGSWLDRGMRQGEPARLEYYLNESDAQRIVDYLRSPGAYYIFECYNTGKGFLQVTKAYPKSVRID